MQDNTEQKQTFKKIIADIIAFEDIDLERITILNNGSDLKSLANLIKNKLEEINFTNDEKIGTKTDCENIYECSKLIKLFEKQLSQWDWRNIVDQNFNGIVNILLTDLLSIQWPDYILNDQQRGDVSTLECATSLSGEEELINIIKLEDTLAAINDKIEKEFSFNENFATDTELENLLDEAQVMKIKLRSHIDYENGVINEALEDLECNIRSAQLQICNADPIRIKEAFENLQHFVKSFQEICETCIQTSQMPVESEDILNMCEHYIEESVQNINKFEEIQELSATLERVPEIAESIKSIQSNMNELKILLNGDFNYIIKNGIYIQRCLENTGNIVSRLEQERQSVEDLSPDVSNSLDESLTIIKDSVSSMWRTLTRVQDFVLREQYAIPFGKILGTVKYLTQLSKCEVNETKKHDLEKYSLCIRKFLKHFEDIKFYVNLDKAARSRNDSKTTKLVLQELKTSTLEFKNYFGHSLMSPENIAILDKFIEKLTDNIKFVESSELLGVDEKIPIFKTLSESLSDWNKYMNQTSQDQSTELKMELKKEEDAYVRAQDSAKNIILNQENQYLTMDLVDDSGKSSDKIDVIFLEKSTAKSSDESILEMNVFKYETYASNQDDVPHEVASVSIEMGISSKMTDVEEIMEEKKSQIEEGNSSVEVSGRYVDDVTNDKSVDDSESAVYKEEEENQLLEYTREIETNEELKLSMDSKDVFHDEELDITKPTKDRLILGDLEDVQMPSTSRDDKHAVIYEHVTENNEETQKADHQIEEHEKKNVNIEEATKALPDLDADIKTLTVQREKHKSIQGRETRSKLELENDSGSIVNEAYLGEDENKVTNEVLEMESNTKQEQQNYEKMEEQGHESTFQPGENRMEKEEEETDKYIVYENNDIQKVESDEGMILAGKEEKTEANLEELISREEETKPKQGEFGAHKLLLEQRGEENQTPEEKEKGPCLVDDSIAKEEVNRKQVDEKKPLSTESEAEKTKKDEENIQKKEGEEDKENPESISQKAVGGKQKKIILEEDRITKVGDEVARNRQQELETQDATEEVKIQKENQNKDKARFEEKHVVEEKEEAKEKHQKEIQALKLLNEQQLKGTKEEKESMQNENEQKENKLRPDEERISKDQEEVTQGLETEDKAIGAKEEEVLRKENEEEENKVSFVQKRIAKEEKRAVEKQQDELKTQMKEEEEEKERGTEEEERLRELREEEEKEARLKEKRILKDDDTKNRKHQEELENVNIINVQQEREMRTKTETEEKKACAQEKSLAKEYEEGNKMQQEKSGDVVRTSLEESIRKEKKENEGKTACREEEHKRGKEKDVYEEREKSCPEEKGIGNQNEQAKKEQKENLETLKLLEEQQEKEKQALEEEERLRKENEENKIHTREKRNEKEEEGAKKQEELEAHGAEPEEVTSRKENEEEEKRPCFGEKNIAKEIDKVEQNQEEKLEKEALEDKNMRKEKENGDIARQQQKEISNDDEEIKRKQHEELVAQKLVREKLEKEKQILIRKEEEENKSCLEEKRVAKEDELAKRNQEEELESHKAESENKINENECLEEKPVAKAKEEEEQKQREELITRKLNKEKQEKENFVLEEEERVRREKEQTEQKVRQEQRQTAKEEEEAKQKQQEELVAQKLLGENFEKGKEALKEEEKSVGPGEEQISKGKTQRNNIEQLEDPMPAGEHEKIRREKEEGENILRVKDKRVKTHEEDVNKQKEVSESQASGKEDENIRNKNKEQKQASLKGELISREEDEANEKHQEEFVNKKLEEETEQIQKEKVGKERTAHLEDEKVAKEEDELNRKQKEKLEGQKEMKKIRTNKEDEENKAQLEENFIAIKEEQAKLKQQEELKSQKTNEEEEVLRNKKKEENKSRIGEERIAQEESIAKETKNIEEKMENEREEEEKEACLGSERVAIDEKGATRKQQQELEYFKIKEGKSIRQAIEEENIACVEEERIPKEDEDAKRKQELEIKKLIKKDQDCEKLAKEDNEKIRKTKDEIEIKDLGKGRIAKEEEEMERKDKLELETQKSEEDGENMLKKKLEEEKKERIKEESIAKQEEEAKQKQQEELAQMLLIEQREKEEPDKKEEEVIRNDNEEQNKTLEKELNLKENEVAKQKQKEEFETRNAKEEEERIRKKKEEENNVRMEEERIAKEKEGANRIQEELETQKLLTEQKEREEESMQNKKEEELEKERIAKENEGAKRTLKEEFKARNAKEEERIQKKREEENNVRIEEERIAKEKDDAKRKQDELETQKLLKEQKESEEVIRNKKEEEMKTLEKERISKEKEEAKRKQQEEFEARNTNEEEERIRKKGQEENNVRIEEERIAKEKKDAKQKQDELETQKLLTEQKQREEEIIPNKKEEEKETLEKERITKEKEEAKRKHKEEFEARNAKEEEESIRKKREEENNVRIEEERIAKEKKDAERKQDELQTQKLLTEQKEREEECIRHKIKEEKEMLEKERIGNEKEEAKCKQEEEFETCNAKEKKERIRKKKEDENNSRVEEERIAKENEDAKRKQEEIVALRLLKEKEDNLKLVKEENERIRKKKEEDDNALLEKRRIAKEEEAVKRKQQEELDARNAKEEEEMIRRNHEENEKKTQLEKEHIAKAEKDAERKRQEDAKAKKSQKVLQEDLIKIEHEKEKQAKENDMKEKEEERRRIEREEKEKDAHFEELRLAKKKEEMKPKRQKELDVQKVPKYHKEKDDSERIDRKEIEKQCQEKELYVKNKDMMKLQDKVTGEATPEEDSLKSQRHQDRQEHDYKLSEGRLNKVSGAKELLTKDRNEESSVQNQKAHFSDRRYNKILQDVDVESRRKEIFEESSQYTSLNSSVITYKSHSEIRESHKGDIKSASSPRTPEQPSRAKAQSESRTNGRASLEKRPIRLRDSKRRPVLSTHLTDRTAVEGSRVKLTCSVLTSSDPTITWHKNGVVLESKTKYRTKFTDGLITLEVLNAVPSDSAEYTCCISNSNGEVSTSANLKVYPSFEASPIPPTFTRSIKDTYHLAEDELVLECRIRGQPLPAITWTKDDKVLGTTDRCQASYLADGVCRLTISRPSADDSGKYTCKAENSVWTDQITHVVEFTGQERLRGPGVNTMEKSRLRHTTELRRPHFSNILTDHAVPSGGTIGLQVEVRGSPSQVEWLREGRRVTDIFSNARTFTEHGLYTLALSDVTESSAGLYTCRAWNTYGKVDMNAEVRVVGAADVKEGRPATIVGRPEKDILISVGEDVNISFRVQGDPKPKVSWFKGTRDITNSYRSCKMTSDDYVMFTLKRSVISDAGTYCIMAKNIYGCDRAFVTVVVRQRASSEHLISDWTYPDDASISFTESSYFRNVPARIPGEPVATDGGANWVSITWDKPDPRASAPVLAYRVDNWLVGKDGGARWTELGVTPINSFDAFNLKQGEEYHFRVTPKNRYGWGEPVQTSAPIAVGAGGNLPEFVEILPGQLKALKGERATLRCCVRGKPAPHVVWFKNGQELEEVDSRVVTTFDGFECCLVINEVRPEDDARYSCEATNSVGRVSTYARLSVVTDRKIWEADIKLNRELSEESSTSGDTFPPQFSMRPRDRRVQMTYPVRLTCQVTGNPPPAVAWHKDGQLLEADDRHSFSQDEHFHTLEISQTTLSDGGAYVATARNQHGTVSCRCTLVVDKGIRAYISPEFSYGLEPLYVVHEGEELRISARVEAYPSVGVAWHRDGVHLRPSRRAVMTLDRDGTVELAVACVSVRDTGVYACTAVNEVGRAVTSCRVRVVEEGDGGPDVPTLIGPDIPYSREPMFVKKPRSCDAYEGDTVIIHCEVVGDPKPEVVWLRDFLKPDYYRDASHFRRVGDGPEYRFEIPHAKLDFTGAYSVIAKNCYGEAKAVISLQIYAKGPDQPSDSHDITHGRVDVLPSIERPLNDLRCCDGDSATFKCVVAGTPSPGVRWTKDGRPLEIGGDFVTSRSGEELALTIREAFPEDQGTYACVAFNDLGHASTAACLIVDVAEERSNQLSAQLSRPPELLLSAGSTPRSTPARSRATTPVMTEYQHEPRRAPASCLKKTAPKFYAYPHNRVVEEGGAARFQCAVAGHPAPWASWDKDGAPLTATSRLTISERDDVRVVEIEQVTLEDAGLYRIVLENDVGRAEATARLDVISLRGSARGSARTHTSPRRSPAVYKHLIGSAMRAGERLKLQADIRSSTPVTYKWYRNGAELAYDPDIATSVHGSVATLMIKHARQEHIGEYMVIADNGYGVTSSFADVLVERDEDRPLFGVALPASLTIPEGGELKLMCQVNCTGDCKVFWYCNNVKLAASKFFRQEKYDDHWYALVVDDAYLEDSGVYRCVVKNQHGSHGTECNVIVREQMTHPSNLVGDEIRYQFVVTPLAVATHVGGTALFTCRTLEPTSEQEVELVWYVAGLPVRLTDPMFHMESDDSGNHRLFVLRADRNMAGEVRCVLRRRDAGRAPLADCCTTLSIVPCEVTYERHDPLAKPEPCSMRPIQDITVARGQVIKIRVHCDGSPKPSIRWMKGGQIIRPDYNGKFPKYCELTHRDGRELLVMRATDEDAGNYNVRLDNPSGAVAARVTVTVVGVPDAPQGKPQATINNSQLYIAWSPPAYDGSQPVARYRVECAGAGGLEPHELDDLGQLEWAEVASVEAPFVQLERLPPDTYYFRVRAVNAQGAGAPSEVSDPVCLDDDDDDEELPATKVIVERHEKYEREYQVMRTLGHGNFGTVRMVKHKDTGKRLAAKIVDAYSEANRKGALKEIRILNLLRHPKLLHLLAAFESPKSVVLVTELLSGGELFERVSADDFTLTEDDCITFIKQICEGVAYMHANSVVHLDLKPENIVCKSRNSTLIKIVDFGLAHILHPDRSVNVSYGTRDFISPEVVNYEPICFETDMWSVGVICYVLLSGLVPFKGDSWCETLISISKVEYDFSDEAFDLVSDDAKDFIRKLLVKRPSSRLSAAASLRHAWLASQGEIQRRATIDKDKLRKFTLRRKWQPLKLRRRIG